MAKVDIVKTAFTEVLAGAGFAISDADAEYAFGDEQPAVNSGFAVPPNGQVNGIEGKKLWARSTNFDSSKVYAEVWA